MERGNALSMHYSDHCCKAVRDQIQVLWRYLSEVSDPDYDFIRTHALALYQFSDILLSASEKEADSFPSEPIASAGLLTTEHCDRALREQIQMLFNYQSANNALDYDFIRTHALCIMQFSEQLGRRVRRVEA
jgi:hypothetical protein